MAQFLSGAWRSRAGAGLLALLVMSCSDPGGGSKSRSVGAGGAEGGAGAPNEAAGGEVSPPQPPQRLALFDSFAPQGLLGAEGGEGGGETGPLGPPYGISDHCGDAIVGSDEECDDGAGGADACTSQCETRDEAGGPGPTELQPSVERYLGVGRHPVSGLEQGFIATYVQAGGDEAAIGATVFNIWGQPAHYVTMSEGAQPIYEANPVAAALPGGRYAAAWGDFDGDGSDLGVALRAVSADGELGPLQAANASHEFSQLNPDMIWTGTQLVIAWEDYADPFNGPDLRYRLFDADLNPISDDVTLAGTSNPEAAVALAPFDGGWAAAYREGTVDGKENIVVRVGEDTFVVGPVSGGPLDDRPALVELDETHLLVAFSADPLLAGTINVPRVRYAVIDTGSVAAPVIKSLDPLDDVLSSNDQIAQVSPSLERSAEGAYLAWRSEARPGDASGDEIWLKHLRWLPDGASFALRAEEHELLIPRTCDGSFGDQRSPALGRSLLPPNGGLIMAWNDFAKRQGPESGEPDVTVHYAPTHLATPASAPQTLLETWAGATGSPWPPRWSSNAAAHVSYTTQYGEGLFNAYSLPGSAFALVNDHTARDIDVVTTMRLGYPRYGGIVLRANSATAPTSYLAGVITSRKAETFKIYSMINGVQTIHASVPIPKSFSEPGVGVGVNLRVRFRSVTNADGSVFAGMKWWLLGANEPAGWLLQAPLPSSYALANVAGRFGVWAYADTSNGGTGWFDDFSARFFEGASGGDVDAVPNPVPLLLPRQVASYRRCTGTAPCTLTDGCCSGDGDCAPGLACSRDQAESLGLGSHASICVAEHCDNQKKDSDEVHADCGGSDCETCDCTSTIAPGAAGYCSGACQCGVGEFPCSHDTHCLQGLLCGVDTGERFGGAFLSDACVPPHCLNRVQDDDETMIDCGGSCGSNCACSPVNGAAAHCRTYCQCPVGQGTCLVDDECVSPLLCGPKGIKFGFATNLNVCTPAHCLNNIKDAGETSADCGAGCGCGGCAVGCVN